MATIGIAGVALAGKTMTLQKLGRLLGLQLTSNADSERCLLASGPDLRIVTMPGGVWHKYLFRRMLVSCDVMICLVETQLEREEAHREEYGWFADAIQQTPRIFQINKVDIPTRRCSVDGASRVARCHIHPGGSADSTRTAGRRPPLRSSAASADPPEPRHAARRNKACALACGAGARRRPLWRRPRREARGLPHVPATPRDQRTVRRYALGDLSELIEDRCTPRERATPREGLTYCVAPRS